MTKTIKIAYYAAIASAFGACIFDVYSGRYGGAGVMALTAGWLIICFKYGQLISEYDVTLKEALSRENIAKRELAKMRRRAQEAERKYRELFNDTPARGAKGR